MSDTNTSDTHTPRKLWMFVLLLFSIVCVIIYIRIEQRAALQKTVDVDGVATVTVVQPESTSANEQLVLPGELHAYLEAPIYARTSGYLKHRLVELGANVKAGEVLAEIDSPETDQQLKQAEADLATAKANYDLAQATAERWQNLAQSNFVSKQDIDQKVSEATAKKAAVASAQANVDRLHELEGFKHVTAPFDGVITARNTDVGALITAGTGSSPELFHIADLRKLRVFVQVPQQQAMLVKPGLNATLTLAEQPGRAIPAKLIRTSRAIDQSSHSLLAELEVDNANNEFMPGGYTEVHLPLSSQQGSYRLPASALIFGSDGIKVATVNDSSQVLLKPVVMGRDFGKQIEILNGLDAQDKVIVIPWDAIANDQLVKIAPDAPKDSGVKK